MFLDENGPDRKVERAKRHLEEFERILGEYESSQPIAVRADVDPQAGLHHYRYQAADPPPSLGLILGEFLYQLRSALDHYVWLIGCSLSPTGEAPRVSEFPIFIDPEDRKVDGRGLPGFDKSGRNKIVGLSEYGIRRIEGMQPYHRTITPEYHPLWVLHELRNLDTHRVIHPVIAQLHVPHMSGQFEIAASPLHNGDVFATVPSSLHPESTFKPNLAFSVCLPVSGATGKRPPVEVLTEIYEHVRFEVMPTLTRLFVTKQ